MYRSKDAKTWLSIERCEEDGRYIESIGHIDKLTNEFIKSEFIDGLSIEDIDAIQTFMIDFLREDDD